MAFADKRRVVTHLIGASVADNTDVKSFIVPAGKEIEIYALKANMRVVSPTALAKIELVKQDNTILLSVALTGTANVVNKQTQTVPLTFLNSGTTDIALKLRTDQATGTGCDGDIECHVSEPGHR